MTVNVFEVSVSGRVFADFEEGVSELLRGIDKAIDRSAVRVKREMVRALQRVSRQMERQHGNPWDGSVAHNNPTLFRRSGGGLRSIRDSIHVRGRDTKLSSIEGRISAARLSVHETGATIRPRSARFLTIPLPAAMDRRGVPLRRRARDWDNTFVATSRRGNLLIFRREAGGIAPLYLLKTSVTLRPRLGMADAVADVLPFFERRAFEQIADAIDTIGA